MLSHTQEETIYEVGSSILDASENKYSGNDATAIPLLPLKNVVLLPRSIRPVMVGRPISIHAVDQALRGQKTLFVTAQKSADMEHPSSADVNWYGTKATILQVMRLSNGAFKILVEGVCRAKATAITQEEGYLSAVIQELPTTYSCSIKEIEAVWRTLRSLYVQYAQKHEKSPEDLIEAIQSSNDIDYLTDTIAMHASLSFQERQEILELVDLKERMLKLSIFIQKELDIIQLEQNIRGRVQTQVDKNQREYYLHEQMKAIQKELGRDDQTQEISQLRTTLKSLKLSPEAQEKVEKELRRLEQMPSLSAEATVSRSYIEWLLCLPWNKVSKDRISISQAEKMLNKNHAGLKKAKERILEFLAAKKFSHNLERSPILCLVGPPGVGKTSLGDSIAKSLGREFVRISLGGVKDEAEIRGHRRTYIGAMPGKIIQAMKKAKTKNPVILLDEIDKLANDIHGDPSAALLEVLDPEQNRSFVDHYLEVEYDLSQVMFIATANVMDSIPYPLFDRMELITLSGYTDDEKLSIAKEFLIPKNLKEYDLTKKQFVLPDALLKQIIAEYTKEAGVRQLERIITKLMRKVIQELLKHSSSSYQITPELIKEWLGHPKYKPTPLDGSAQRIGLATGLAWTEVGGDTLEVEATVMPGKGQLTLTGQLGDVMQESVHAAFSYIRSRAAQLGLKSSFHTSKDIHVHVPEGATPKDGPSAGITMCVALVSALTKNPTYPQIAMTGEITLRGRVLGVGGLKEKILAAKQQGVKKILVPKENSDDIEEILKEIDPGVTLVHVDTMDHVLRETLVENPFQKRMKKRTSRKKTT